MDDQDHRTEGRTDYDWIHGMRIGMIVGAVLGLLVGWSLGGFPVVWLIIGAAAGGFLGAKMAPRW